MGKTVLVLGAGSSCEVSLPSGDKLKGEISQLLRYSIDDFRRVAGLDAEIHRAYNTLSREGAYQSINPYLQASRKIIGGLPLVFSIDNFLDIRRGDKDVEICGKLAIARAILSAEAASKMATSRTRESISMPALEQTWFAKFFQLLCEGCSVDELGTRLSGIAVVIFNYDRCFEHFLYYALQAAYGVKPEEAARLVATVEIYHAYGTVGVLPWQQEGNLAWSPKGPRVPFGGAPEGYEIDLIPIAKNLKTFTESTDAEIAGSVRKLVAEADRLIFLGFAFHGLNLQFLFDPEADRNSAPGSCFGSAYGMSASNVESIKGDLMYKGRLSPERIVLSNALCADFISDNSRIFSFR